MSYLYYKIYRFISNCLYLNMKLKEIERQKPKKFNLQKKNDMFLYQFTLVKWNFQNQNSYILVFEQKDYF